MTNEDRDIERLVKLGFERFNYGTDLVNITVDVKEGHVTIGGTTGNVAIIDELVNAAKAVPGVRSVTNGIDTKSN